MQSVSAAPGKLAATHGTCYGCGLEHAFLVRAQSIRSVLVVVMPTGCSAGASVEDVSLCLTSQPSRSPSSHHHLSPCTAHFKKIPTPRLGLRWRPSHPGSRSSCCFWLCTSCGTSGLLSLSKFAPPGTFAGGSVLNPKLSRAFPPVPNCTLASPCIAAFWVVRPVRNSGGMLDLSLPELDLHARHFLEATVLRLQGVASSHSRQSRILVDLVLSLDPLVNSVITLTDQRPLVFETPRKSHNVLLAALLIPAPTSGTQS